jgi:hypothetical protein
MLLLPITFNLCKLGYLSPVFTILTSVILLQPNRFNSLQFRHVFTTVLMPKSLISPQKDKSRLNKFVQLRIILLKILSSIIENSIDSQCKQIPNIPIFSAAMYALSRQHFKCQSFIDRLSNHDIVSYFNSFS